MKYLVIFLILIGFVGSAFGQYLGDKIPPDTIYDKQSGSYIFPKNYLDFYYSDVKFQQYSLISGSYQYDVPYEISNGTLTKMTIDCNSVEMVLEIEAIDDQGSITIALPRYLIDAKLGSDNDDVFFVLQDSHEVHFTELDVIDTKLRILLIPFSSDVSKIRIIGVNYPEALGEQACNGEHEPPISYLISPLQQFHSGIQIEEIQCEKGLILITKSSDGSPACVMPESIPKLIDRKWGNIFYFDKVISVRGVEYSLKHGITGGATVEDVIYRDNTNSIVVRIDSITTGNLVVELSQNLLEPLHRYCDDKYPDMDDAFFIVLIDDLEVFFEEITATPEQRTLSIPFQENSSEIEIIATCLI